MNELKFKNLLITTLEKTWSTPSLVKQWEEEKAVIDGDKKKWEIFKGHVMFKNSKKPHKKR